VNITEKDRDAFQDRGQGDFLASHDPEDIITVVDGRPELTDELAGASPEIREYLRSRFADFFRQDASVTALPGHLTGEVASQARLPSLLATIRRLACEDSPSSVTKRWRLNRTKKSTHTACYTLARALLFKIGTTNRTFHSAPKSSGVI
jgi:hypothetical protein